MIDLVAKSAAAGLLPATIGTLTLAEMPQSTIHSIAPLKGTKPKGFPAVGRSASYGEGKIVWSARGQYFVIGATPPKLKAAVTDQSDAWCHVSLTGADAHAAMARLCPLDTAKMADGDVARSLVGHMSALIIRTQHGFEIMVFRAFAKTLVHEVSEVMTSLAAQENLTD